MRHFFSLVANEFSAVKVNNCFDPSKYVGLSKFVNFVWPETGLIHQFNNNSYHEFSAYLTSLISRCFNDKFLIHLSLMQLVMIKFNCV